MIRTLLACVGLAIGACLGLAGTFAPSASLRGLAWGIDGAALVMASALLTVDYFEKGEDLIASGFLVFAIGEGVILVCAPLDLSVSVPFFGAGASLWAVGLALISAPPFLPLPVRVLGGVTSVMFAATALQIFAGAQISAVTSPLPFYAYPFLVATIFGWIWSILKNSGAT